MQRGNDKLVQIIGQNDSMEEAFWPRNLSLDIRKSWKVGGVSLCNGFCMQDEILLRGFMHIEPPVSLKAQNFKQLNKYKHFEENPPLWTYCNNYLMKYCLFIQTF